VHKKLSVDLHGFIAQATLEDHPNKSYMISAPTPIMRKIFIDKLNDTFGNSEEHIYFSYNNHPFVSYPQEAIESLQNNHEAMIAAGYYTTDRIDLFRNSLSQLHIINC
jgi:hypothetical protein